MQEEVQPETDLAVTHNEDVEVEVMGELQSAQQKQHVSTRKMLQEVDDSRLEGQPSLVDSWDRIARFNDTNELVRVNIQQVQQMLQEAYEEHQHQKIEDNERLKGLKQQAKADPRLADDYTLELHRVQTERKNERKQIQNLAVTGMGLAAEYRKCAMQRAMFIHINMISQFTVMVTASIQRHVKDPHDMRAILEDIKNAKRVCFPSEDRE
ncbi:MAG: hypothetical protein D4S01_01375 [Dehalococcoidia bacterium]|nr:MAG: hypothetical protein D4S01_01375 [Dehalococcoidia bacterium]